MWFCFISHNGFYALCCYYIEGAYMGKRITVFEGKKEKYNWILNRLKNSEKLPNDKVGVFVWWFEKRMFSATPLRSYLKRLKKKERKECFRISRSVKTKSLLKKLVESTKTHVHSWDDCYLSKELSEYLEAGLLRLKKQAQSKTTKQPSMEVVDQQSEPEPSTSQQSESLQEEGDVSQEDNNLALSERQMQMSGLILKILTHVSVGVTNMTVTNWTGLVRM